MIRKTFAIALSVLSTLAVSQSASAGGYWSWFGLTSWGYTFGAGGVY